MERKMYDKFKSYYFKDKDVESISDDFVDIIVESNEVFVKYFKEGKTRLQVAEELETHNNIVGSIMSSNVEKVAVLYEIFERTNRDLNLLHSLLNVKSLDKYKEDIIGLHAKGVENPLMYARFTKYYFPKLTGKLGRASNNYLGYIDEIVTRKRVLWKYFQEGKSSKEIAEEMDLEEYSVKDKIYRAKSFVVNNYERYLNAVGARNNKQNVKNTKK